MVRDDIIDGLPDVAGVIPPSGADARIEVAATKNDPAAAAILDIDVDDRTWDDALAMAAKSYVPASDVSRTKGAGAGLRDDN